MRFATRFALGAAVGVFVAFWAGLLSETASRHFGWITLAAVVVFGLLGQLPGHRIRAESERAAPYVLGGVALVVVSILLAAAIDLRRERDRCLRCCNSAGYPSMIYPQEHRMGPRECRCQDRTDPQHPRNDAQVCMYPRRGPAR
jgi:hypothetical protein